MILSKDPQPHIWDLQQYLCPIKHQNINCNLLKTLHCFAYPQHAWSYEICGGFFWSLIVRKKKRINNFSWCYLLSILPGKIKFVMLVGVSPRQNVQQPTNVEWSLSFKSFINQRPSLAQLSEWDSQLRSDAPRVNIQRNQTHNTAQWSSGNDEQH